MASVVSFCYCCFPRTRLTGPAGVTIACLVSFLSRACLAPGCVCLPGLVDVVTRLALHSSRWGIPSSTLLAPDWDTPTPPALLPHQHLHLPLATAHPQPHHGRGPAAHTTIDAFELDEEASPRVVDEEDATCAHGATTLALCGGPTPVQRRCTWGAPAVVVRARASSKAARLACWQLRRRLSAIAHARADGDGVLGEHGRR